jgi:nitrite reductase/ring-hydroxylating ferredoxin subunit
MDEDSRIAAVEEVPADGSLLFTVRDGFDREEAILLGLADGVVALRNYCPHWTDVRLDKGSGATRRNGELVCEKHGATFEAATGECTHGPCEGATIERLEVTVADGNVYLTDEDYEFEEVGPSGEHDLSSRGRIDFSGN